MESKLSDSGGLEILVYDGERGHTQSSFTPLGQQNTVKAQSGRQKLGPQTQFILILDYFNMNINKKIELLYYSLHLYQKKIYSLKNQI